MKNLVRLAFVAVLALGLAASTQGASAAGYHGSQTITGGPSGGSTTN